MQHDYEGGAKLVAPFVIHTIDIGVKTVGWRCLRTQDVSSRTERQATGLALDSQI
ncbi:hypothetical protein [Lactiplantibacillus pentosus]|uniref:hypothetical protein n=1 Tax=Lactiplantibacillus pentosus TaxID=1589 RepID=UPI001CDB170F|nr:hypothetical protein [Lactiplantibacillus pentosus]